jgi:hypothetical protein
VGWLSLQLSLKRAPSRPKETSQTLGTFVFTSKDFDEAFNLPQVEIYFGGEKVTGSKKVIV